MSYYVNVKYNVVNTKLGTNKAMKKMIKCDGAPGNDREAATIMSHLKTTHFRDIAKGAQIFTTQTSLGKIGE